MNPEYQTVDTIEELEKIQGTPGRLAQHKVIRHVDAHCRQFILHSPFLVMSTTNKKGSCDSSPRGDQPGFVHILDSKHILLPERIGNRRMDSMRNLIENPQIGLLFMIPGIEETLRINGNAKIIKERELLKQLEAKGHVPNVAIIVKVEECYIHCAKAFKRSKLWNPSEWPDTTTLPTPAKMLTDHAKLEDFDENRVQSSLIESYTHRLY